MLQWYPLDKYAVSCVWHSASINFRFCGIPWAESQGRLDFTVAAVAGILHPEPLANENTRI